jgi:hypothetical protein
LHTTIKNNVKAFVNKREFNTCICVYIFCMGNRHHYSLKIERI